MIYFESHRFFTSEFNLDTVNEEDVIRYIMSIKSNALGYDGISRDRVILTLPHTLKAITSIINRSIARGAVLEQWKVAMVNLLPKVDSRSDFKYFALFVEDIGENCTCTVK